MILRPPTSAVLSELLDEAPPDRVTIGWIMNTLHDRSFGLVLFLLALIALVPGLSMFIGVLLVLPAGQMILARDHPILPGMLARRSLPTRRFARLIDRVVPVLRWIEALIRPRWPLPLVATKRLVGGAVLLLGLTLVAPIPLSNVVPALAIMLIALAYLEEDGVMLAIALLVALVSLAMTAALVWAAIVGIEFLDRL